MVTFLLIAKDEQKRTSYLVEQINKYAIDPFDVMEIDNQTIDKTTTIGIETIKYIKQKIFLTPLKSKNKLLVIKNAGLLTPEAQNALLKLLEEPPDHTFIYLEAADKEVFLPTILSRCQIITLSNDQVSLSEQEKKEIETFLIELPELAIGEKLKKAEQLAKDKKQTLLWLENLVIVGREKLLQTTDSTNATIEQGYYFHTVQSFQRLHTLIQTTNVNLRLAIETTLLSLAN